MPRPADRRRSVVALAAALAMTATLTGCAVLFRGIDQTIPVDSTPPGAQVMLDGEGVGVTPVEIRVSRRRAHTLTVTRPRRVRFARGGRRRPAVEGSRTLQRSLSPRPVQKSSSTRPASPAVGNAAAPVTRRWHAGVGGGPCPPGSPAAATTGHPQPNGRPRRVGSPSTPVERVVESTWSITITPTPLGRRAPSPSVPPR